MDELEGFYEAAACGSVGEVPDVAVAEHAVLAALAHHRSLVRFTPTASRSGMEGADR